MSEIRSYEGAPHRAKESVLLEFGVEPILEAVADFSEADNAHKQRRVAREFFDWMVHDPWRYQDTMDAFETVIEAGKDSTIGQTAEELQVAIDALQPKHIQLKGEESYSVTDESWKEWFSLLDDERHSGTATKVVNGLRKKVVKEPHASVNVLYNMFTGLMADAADKDISRSSIKLIDSREYRDLTLSSQELTNIFCGMYSPDSDIASKSLELYRAVASLRTYHPDYEVGGELGGANFDQIIGDKKYRKQLKVAAESLIASKGKKYFDQWTQVITQLGTPGVQIVDFEGIPDEIRRIHIVHGPLGVVSNLLQNTRSIPLIKSGGMIKDDVPIVISPVGLATRLDGGEASEYASERAALADLIERVSRENLLEQTTINFTAAVETFLGYAPEPIDDLDLEELRKINHDLRAQLIDGVQQFIRPRGERVIIDDPYLIDKGIKSITFGYVDVSDKNRIRVDFRIGRANYAFGLDLRNQAQLFGLRDGKPLKTTDDSAFVEHMVLAHFHQLRCTPVARSNGSSSSSEGLDAIQTGRRAHLRLLKPGETAHTHKNAEEYTFDLEGHNTRRREAGLPDETFVRAVEVVAQRGLPPLTIQIPEALGYIEELGINDKEQYGPAR